MWYSLLNEGISSTVYHFCPLYALYRIIETNSFKLTSTDSRPSDKSMTRLPVNLKTNEYKEYKYYMCFSRTSSSVVGYPMMKREREGYILWKYCLVRLKINGNLLNANYKGMPVNYFNDKSLDKIDHFIKIDPKTKKMMPDVVDSEGNMFANHININMISKDRPNSPKKSMINRRNPHHPDPMSKNGEREDGVAYIDYGEIDRNQMLEYEDRIFSNKEYIPNAFRYIERIDIFVDSRILSDKLKDAHNALECINYILERYGDITYVYDNLPAFESSNFKNATTIERLKAKAHDYINSIEYKQYHIDSFQTKMILQYVMLVLYHPLKNYLQQTYQYIEDNEFPNQEEAKEIAETLYRQKFAENNPITILKLPFTFSREIPRLSPIIFDKYVKPIEGLKNQYEQEYGKSISTIKRDLAAKVTTYK